MCSFGELAETGTSLFVYSSDDRPQLRNDTRNSKFGSLYIEYTDKFIAREARLSDVTS